MKTEQVDIVQEPHSQKLQTVGLSKTSVSTVIHQKPKDNEEDDKIWAVTTIPNGTLDVMKLDKMCNAHCVCIQVKTRNTEFFLVNLYCQPSKPLTPKLNWLRSILECLREKRIMICGHFSAKSTSWFNDSMDRRGEELELFIAEHKLYVLNEPQDVTTYESSIGTSNIDLTLVSGNLLRGIAKWEIKSE